MKFSGANLQPDSFLHFTYAGYSAQTGAIVPFRSCELFKLFRMSWSTVFRFGI